MSTYLLDVNVLIALIDSAHIQHDAAHVWFGQVGHKAFATCPLTENGLVRIVGHPKYPNSPGPPSTVMGMLTAIRAMPGHVFWPDKFSLCDVKHVVANELTSHTRVTDSYLLALARINKGKLATFDRTLATQAVTNGESFIERL